MNLDRLKRQAHHATAYGLKAGILEKLPCEVCGSLIVHAHHDDYAKPDDIRWLCPKHHVAVHRALGCRVGATKQPREPRPSRTELLEFARDLGGRGGNATKKKLGKKHFSEAGKKGNLVRWGKKVPQ
jgi:hypothetical protein